MAAVKSCKGVRLSQHFVGGRWFQALRPTAALVLTAWQTACAVVPESPSETLAVGASPLLEGTLSHSSSVVGVRASRAGSTSLCTGTLLLPNLVLTARHCLAPGENALEGGNCKTSVISAPDSETTVIVIAAPDVDQATEEQTHAVSDAWLPEDDAKLCGEDLALLYLREPVTGTPIAVTQTLPAVDAPFTTYGYGIADGDYGRQRKLTTAAITCSGKDCDDARIAANELLASSGACEGDSGGPALDEQGQLFALASRSDSLCTETAYVTFANHFDWLSVAVREAANAGKFDVPKWARPVEVKPETPPAEEEPPVSFRAAGGCAVGAGDASPSNVAWLFVPLVGILARRGRRRGRFEGHALSMLHVSRATAFSVPCAWARRYRGGQVP